MPSERASMSEPSTGRADKSNSARDINARSARAIRARGPRTERQAGGVHGIVRLCRVAGARTAERGFTREGRLAYENLLVEAHEGVSFVSVNRADKRNALDAATIEELDAAFAALGGDPAVRGVVLTGAGESIFAAGADIGELEQLPPAGAHGFSERGRRLCRPHRVAGQARGRGRQRLRAGGRLRAGARLPRAHRVGQRRLRPAGGQARADLRLRRDPAPAAARRQGARARAAAHRRAHRRHRGAAHRPRQQGRVP